MAAKKKAKKAKAKKSATKSSAKKKVAAIPAGYSTVCPGFAHPNAKDAIPFLQTVFGGKVRGKPYVAPDGSIAHCEMKIGDTVIMFGSGMDGTQYGMHASIYVKDCDAVVAKAIAAGATAKRPLETQFYGDRAGSVVDPFGNEWFIMTHVEDVSKKEMDRRMALVMSGKSWTDGSDQKQAA